MNATDMVSAYHRAVDERGRGGAVCEAARAWSIWEGSTSKLFLTLP